MNYESIPINLSLLSHNDSVLLTVYSDHVEGLSLCNTEPPSLSDRIERDPLMLSKDISLPVKDRPGRDLLF